MEPIANIDIHLFRTRDGQWRARAQFGVRTLYSRPRRQREFAIDDVMGLVRQHVGGGAPGKDPGRLPGEMPGKGSGEGSGGLPG